MWFRGLLVVLFLLRSTAAIIPAASRHERFWVLASAGVIPLRRGRVTVAGGDEQGVTRRTGK